MNVTYWTGFSKRKNSTKRPATTGTDVTCNLKDDTSILFPDIDSATIPANANYMYISDFGRYYFVRDVTKVGASRNLFSLEVDPMGSYKSNVGSSSFLVERAASSYDGTITDSIYPRKADVTKNLVSSATSPFSPSSGFSSGIFIIGVINSEQNVAGSVAYYATSINGIRSIMGKLFDKAGMQSTLGLGHLSGDLYSEYMADYNPFQYIVSCKFLPGIAIDSSLVGSAQSTLKLGYFELTGIVVDGLYPLLPNTGLYDNVTQISLDVPKHPQAATRGDYLNGSEFSNYVLAYNPFGILELPADLMLDLSKIYLDTYLDYITGTARLVVTGDTSEILAMQEVDFGIDIQLAQMTANLFSQKNNAFSGVVSAASQFVTAGTSASAMINAVTGIPGTIMDTIGNFAKIGIPNLATKGNNEGFLGVVQPFAGENTVDLYGVFYTIAGFDDANLGRPLCQKKTISSLSGYVKCSGASIDIPGYPQEKDIVNDYLNSGFYYE